jgi:N-acetyl-anhydromuramyl-L-alanine amidase AmpD
MRNIDKIIVHCSDSEFGDAAVIDRWHRERGWKGIGYHYVILNGEREKGKYRAEDNGLIEAGRPVDEVGAHCKGHNDGSIGICLIGRRLFTAEQLCVSLPALLNDLRGRFDIRSVYGHCQLDRGKTCPNFDVDVYCSVFRRDI